jgi:predicted negative regulator of RcsB-dependent stress response
VTIDVADLRKRAERTFPQVYPSELTELLDAYEERDRLRDEIERAAQLAVEAKNTILKLRGSLDFAQTETERDRLRAALERLRKRMAEPQQPIIQWDAGTWIERIDAALEGRE